MENTSDKNSLSHFEQFAQCTSHTLSDPVRKIIATLEPSATSQENTATALEAAKELLKSIQQRKCNKYRDFLDILFYIGSVFRFKIGYDHEQKLQSDFSNIQHF